MIKWNKECIGKRFLIINTSNVDYGKKGYIRNRGPVGGCFIVQIDNSKETAIHQRDIEEIT